MQTLVTGEYAQPLHEADGVDVVTALGPEREASRIVIDYSKRNEQRHSRVALPSVSRRPRPEIGPVWLRMTVRYDDGAPETDRVPFLVMVTWYWHGTPERG